MVRQEEERRRELMETQLREDNRRDNRIQIRQQDRNNYDDDTLNRMARMERNARSSRNRRRR